MINSHNSVESRYEMKCVERKCDRIFAITEKKKWNKITAAQWFTLHEIFQTQMSKICNADLALMCVSERESARMAFFIHQLENSN